jgi:hypothetical protein
MQVHAQKIQQICAAWHWNALKARSLLVVVVAAFHLIFLKFLWKQNQYVGQTNKPAQNGDRLYRTDSNQNYARPWRRVFWVNLTKHNAQEACITEKKINVLYDGEVIGVCRADIVTMCHVIEVKAVRKMPIGVEYRVWKYAQHLVEMDGKTWKALVINFNQEYETIETKEPQLTKKTNQPLAFTIEDTEVKHRKIKPVQDE